MEFGLGPEKPPTSVVVKKNLQREIIYQMSPLEVIKSIQVIFEINYNIRYLLSLK